MHLAEGVLSAPALLGAALAGAAGIAIGLRRLGEAQLPLAALLGAAFFVASTIHVPVGVGSVHLILNGLAGLLLGWAAFPVFFVALLLQAALFSFGGFAVLGANLVIMALPALAAHYALRGLVARAVANDPPSRSRLLAAGAGCGLIGIGGAILVASALLALAGGRAFSDLIALLAIAHLPVLAVDAAIGALTVGLLARMLPRALTPAAA